MSDRAFQILAKDLEQRIQDGTYPQMSRLPPERELAAEFGVSRTTVREALMMLETAGVLQIRDRSGAYVLPPTTTQNEKLPIFSADPGPYEVLQLRRLIEGEACYQVATRGTEEQIAAIVAACEANAAVAPNDTPEFHAATRAFHHAIMVGSENALFVHLFEFLWDQKSGPLWGDWYRSTKSQSNRVRVLANNQAITEMISARRAQAARTAMEHHIDWMITRFLGY